MFFLDYNNITVIQVNVSYLMHGYLSLTRTRRRLQYRRYSRLCESRFSRVSSSRDWKRLRGPSLVLENLENKRLYECYTVVRLIPYQQHCGALTFGTYSSSLRSFEGPQSFRHTNISYANIRVRERKEIIISTVSFTKSSLPLNLPF